MAAAYHDETVSEGDARWFHAAFPNTVSVRFRCRIIGFHIHANAPSREGVEAFHDNHRSAQHEGLSRYDF